MKADLRRTPLHAQHQQLGGRMVDFAGWSMPVQYDGLLKEHERVRSNAGLFDVSHMGELFFTGPGAQSTLDNLATNNVAKMVTGQVLYTALCNEEGGVRDDALIYRLGDSQFMMVVNASNTAKILEWSNQHLDADTVLEDRTASIALVALQGPRSREIIRECKRLGDLKSACDDLAYYRSVQDNSSQELRLVSRTGYTGELGFEIYWPASGIEDIWKELMEVGKPLGLGAVGLGARDTLRFEAAYSLYGHELDEDITPLESGIGWTVKLKKSKFVGQSALREQKAQGPPRQIIGLELKERAIARQGFQVVVADRVVGRITSGTFAPSLQKSLSLALVDAADVDSELFIRVRGKDLPATRVPLPFYKPE